jgi:UDP-glucuronate 4-epimerase
LANSAGRSRNSFFSLGTQAQLRAHETDPFTSFRAARLPRRRYLVTGCAGFIGSQLTQVLAASGCSVVGVDCFTDTYPRAVKEGNIQRSSVGGDVEFHERDLAEAALDPLLEGVSGVFHLAGRPGVRTSWGATFEHYLRDNVLATQRVFEAALRLGVRVVYASSSSVYGDAEAYPLREDAKPIPVSPYGVSKLSCEALATSYSRSLELDAVGMRYFSVYGPRQRPDMAFSRVFDCIANDRPFRLFGSGHQSRDFTYVGDVVDATIAAMARGTAGGVYNIGGGSEISLLDSLTLCEQVAGRRLEVAHVAAATGDARRTVADYDKAATELGWSPRTTLEEGLRAQAHEALGVDPVDEPPRHAQPLELLESA